MSQATAATIHEAFAAWGRIAPRRPAVSWNACVTTYGELNAAASRLARRLTVAGGGAGRRIGILLPRSDEWIVGVLGVLKAGGAYVPLDVAWPRARLERIAADAALGAVVTNRAFATAVPSAAVPVMIEETAHANGDDGERGVQVDPRALAYVIFTSGSTGQPKGVMVDHRSVMNLAAALRQAIYDDLPDGPLRIGVNGPLTFDTSVKQIVQIAMGHTLYVVPDAARLDPAALVAFLDASRLDVLDCTPTQLNEWIAAGVFSRVERRPRVVLVGGEAIAAGLWHKLRGLDGIAFHNLYGPTECTVDATHCRVTRRRATPRLGMSLAGVQVHILDEELRPVADADAGELCIGGAGVAQGYLARPALTAARFVPNPFGADRGERLYRTGDLGRRLPDGEVEFVGRRDRQVKVRGVRIELAEIESILAAHAGVRQAAVVLRPVTGGSERLVAYVVPAAPEAAPHERRRLVRELRDRLRSTLPEYMVPSALTCLRALPRTANGKVDERALPASADDDDLDPAYVAPRTRLEATIGKIWRDVLGRRRIGVHDRFFDLGGHSLLVAQVAARMRDRCKRAVPIERLFACATIADQARLLETIPRLRPHEASPISRADRPDVLPLSFAQERVWFVEQIVPGNAAYLFRTILHFFGSLNVRVLERALSEIVRRHEALRTTFAFSDGQPCQTVHAPWPVTVPVVDATAAIDGDRLLAALRDRECRRPFDLGRLPLLRWMLVRLAPDRHALIHVEHHLIHDGWSFNVFLDELRQLLVALSGGQPSPLPPLSIQFADFCVWQRDWADTADAAAQLMFWKTQLAGAPLVLDLPFDRPRPPVQRLRGILERIELPASLANRLRRVSRAEGSTLFMTMLTAFFVLLHKYTGQLDILVGSGLANRRRREAEPLIGMIVNSVVLRARLADNPTFAELLAQVRSVTLDAYANQDVPFDAVVDALQPVRDPSYNPLFQAAFSFHDAPLPDLSFPGGRIEVDDLLDNGSAKFDINIIAIPRAEQRGGRRPAEGADGITLIVECNSDIFERTTIARVCTHYIGVLEAMAADVNTRVGGCALSTRDERVRLDAWNATAADCPARPIHAMFEAQARDHPRAVALLDRGGAWSYQELACRSTALAHRLRAHEVRPGAVVGVCMRRSRHLVAALLAVLETGAAYLPLDPDQPKHRLDFTVADAGASLLLVDASTATAMTAAPTPVLAVDDAWDGHDGAAADPLPDVHPDDLAYVIYTSGSTGQPKGVGVTHRAVVNVATALAGGLSVTERDRLFAVSGIAFDIAALELFMPLCTGASCWIAADAIAAGSTVVRELEQSAATMVQATPSGWRGLLDQGWSPRHRITMLCGGEPLAPSLAEELLRHGPLWNVYGPTEATIWSTAHAVQAGAAVVPIGRPIANTSTYVLDAHLERVPIGVFGELFLGGMGLAIGYLHRPALTANAFVPHPFAAAAGERLYRTGDVVRYRTDGTLEFAGRRDHQVKIRGFRIELGEIEAVVTAHPDVRQAVVVASQNPNGDRRLVAYVVPRAVSPAAGQWTAALRAYLAERLPRYMVPAGVVVLNELPTTPNGKIDRAALCAVAPTPMRAFAAPSTPIESTLARLCAETLGVARIGMRDNFFEAGGHSLAAMRVVARLQQELAVEVPLLAVFEHPVLADLSTLLESLVAQSRRLTA